MYTPVEQCKPLEQVYYDLRAERKQQGKEKEVALVRVEQLAPFPFDLINRELKRYPNADVMWCALPGCSGRSETSLVTQMFPT